MKIKIKMRRSRGDAWRGKIGKKEVTACPSDVTVLFTMGRDTIATFELSNVRPREHEDYHVFEYTDFGHYTVTEVTFGLRPSLTYPVSRVIRDAFLAKKQVTSPIYVSVY